MNKDIRTERFGIADIFGLGWHVYWSKFSTILIIGLCIYLPAAVVGALVPDDTVRQILVALICAVATVAIAYVVERAVRGEETAWGLALGHGVSRWPSVVGTMLVAGIILVLLTLLLVIPGVIWGIYYTFWIFVVALRNIAGKEALDYSKKLVKGRWWAVCGMLLLLELCGIVLGFAIGALAGAAPGIFPELSTPGIANTLFAVAYNFSVLIVNAFFLVVQVVWFLNLDYVMNPVPAAPSPSLVQGTLGAPADAAQR